MIVRRNEIEYLRPVEDLTRPLLVDVGIARIGRTSYVMRHTMRDADTVYAIADAVMVHFDPETGKGVPLSRGGACRARGVSDRLAPVQGLPRQDSPGVAEEVRPRKGRRPRGGSDRSAIGLTRRGNRGARRVEP